MTQLNGRTLLCFVDAQLRVVSGAGVMSLHLFYQLNNVPRVHLCLCSHGLELLCRLAHIEPLNLGVDSM